MYSFTVSLRCCDSALGIATRQRGSNSGRNKIGFRTAQTGSGVQPASYWMGTAFFHASKAAKARR
jgi:hypothetical protein